MSRLLCRLFGGHVWTIDWDSLDLHRLPCQRCGAKP
jgi:hypothetical protein